MCEGGLVWLLLNSARTIGLSAACAATVLYGVAFAAEPTWPVAALMALTLAAAWVSFAVRPLALCAVSLVSFFPFGLYLAFVPGYSRWIALCDVLYLVAGGLMLVARGYRGAHDPRT